MTVERILALGRSKQQAAIEDNRVLLHALETDTTNRFELMNSFERFTDWPIDGIDRGAEYGPARQWPVAYPKDLAGQLVADGYRVWALGPPEHDSSLKEFSVTQGPNPACRSTAGIDIPGYGVYL